MWFTRDALALFHLSHQALADLHCGGSDALKVEDVDKSDEQKHAA